MVEGKAVVLFGHGARDPEWAGPMRRVRERMLQAAPGLSVELAFLEFMQPTLADAIDRLVGAGATQVTVVPMFLAQGGHLKRDVPELIESARHRHPGCIISVTNAIGETDEVAAAVAAFALNAVQ